MFNFNVFKKNNIFDFLYTVYDYSFYVNLMFIPIKLEIAH